MFNRLDQRKDQRNRRRISIDFIQNEAREKKEKNNEQSLSALWVNIVQCVVFFCVKRNL